MIYELSVHMCIHVEQWPDHWLVWDQHILKMRQTQLNEHLFQISELSLCFQCQCVTSTPSKMLYPIPFHVFFFHSPKRAITVSLNTDTFKRESNL